MVVSSPGGHSRTGRENEVSFSQDVMETFKWSSSGYSQADGPGAQKSRLG